MEIPPPCQVENLFSLLPFLSLPLLFSFILTTSGMRTVALSLFLTAIAVPSGRSQTPFWPYPEFPVRLAFTLPPPPLPTPRWILPVHHADLPFLPASFQLTPPNSRTPLPLQILFQTPHQTFLETHLEPSGAGDRSLFLYLSPSNPPPTATFPLVANLPILVSLYPSRGRCFPENWNEILFFLQTKPNPFRLFSLSQFPAEITRDKRPAILAIETALALPDAGTYRIRAFGPQPLIGALNAVPLDEKTLEGTIIGPTLVRLRLFNGMADSPVTIGLEWKPPNADRFTPVPHEALISYASAIPTRLEILTRTLQPAFSAQLLRPYGFHLHPHLFFPVRFTDASINWLPHPYTPDWLFPDGTRSSDPTTFFVFTSPGPHTVSLTLQDALGFTATVSHVVQWTDTVPHLYPFSAIPAPLPPAAFRADWLEPTLLTRGQWPDTLSLELTALLITSNAPPLTNIFFLQPSHYDRPLQMARCRAGEFLQLEWTIRHQGTVVTNGRIRAFHPPFPPHQTYVVADRLLDEDGQQIVYVVPRLPPPLPFPLLPPAPIRLLDDFLVHPSIPEAATTLPSLIAERLKEEVSYHPLRDHRTLSSAWTPLLKFEEIPSLAGSPPARLVLAIGGQDLENDLPPEQFERQAAALSDRLLSAGFALIWATLPPFPERTEKARAYAIALRRVAESRRIPIADLFTVFSGSESEGSPLFSDLFPMSLTARGRRIAADIITERIESLATSSSPSP